MKSNVYLLTKSSYSTLSNPTGNDPLKVTNDPLKPTNDPPESDKKRIYYEYPINITNKKRLNQKIQPFAAIYMFSLH